ncbi:MAG: glycoside hydrolase family 68 protein [Hyphomicrobiaceae bacterium]|nr:glycoside hydrolase family 68 protein [Hyphomicrobiaceae bacterium]
MLCLECEWVWDSWYAQDKGLWHAFFLKADRALVDPDLRHFNVSQGHAISRDLVHWTYLGTSFAPSSGPAFDDMTTWTGSVIKAKNGEWHLFYTGGSRSEGALIQRIGHAVSTDLQNWTRAGETGLCLDLNGPNAALYETEHRVGHWHDRAMRDPFVIADPDGDGYLMFFTARVAGMIEANAAGAIGFATSPDLDTWTLQEPVFAGAFGQLEVPQVFRMGKRWYCLFCTSAAHWSEAHTRTSGQSPVTGNHYLIADDLRGPWKVAPGPFLDGGNPCRRYAARLLETEDGPVLIGFADQTKAGFGGYLLDPEPVHIEAGGLLRLGPRQPAVGIHANEK